MLIIIILLILIGIIIIGDATYSAIVKFRLKQWESHIERDADGVQQGRQEFTVGNGDIALLMIHGFGDSPSLYKKFAPALAEKGFTCKAMRLPGFAEPMNKYSQTSMDLWLEKLEQEINLFKQKHSKIWIIAHSLGGTITIRYLLKNSQGIEGVILLAPLIEVSSQHIPLLSARALYRLGSRCMFFTKMFENYLPVDIQDLEARKKHEIFTDHFIPLKVYDELFKLIDSLKGKESEIKLPLLMILLSNDWIIESKASELFYQKISSVNKSLIILKNSGHVIPLDYEWKEAVSIISTFINNKKI